MGEGHAASSKKFSQIHLITHTGLKCALKPVRWAECKRSSSEARRQKSGGNVNVAARSVFRHEPYRCGTKNIGKAWSADCGDGQMTCASRVLYPAPRAVGPLTAETMTADAYLFFFSCFACLFSFAVFWGCFFLSFFVSWALDILLTS